MVDRGKENLEILMEGNKLKIVAPHEKLTLKPGANILLKVNGEEIFERVEVTAADDIEVWTTLERWAPLFEYHLVIGQDGMQAVMKITREYGHDYELLAQKGEDHIVIEARSQTLEPPNTLPYEEVMELLKAHGVVYGLKEEVIRNGVIPKWGILTGWWRKELCPRPPKMPGSNIFCP